MGNKIEVKNAIKRYGKKEVLKNVNLNVEEGTICGIVGRNGSGKTVLFKCICGISKLTEGEILIDGRKAGGNYDIVNQIGCIIETPGFLQQFSGYRNLKLLSDINRKIGKKEIYETIQKVGLEPKSRKKVGKYSLGMRQRLAIAQAIMENPSILVLDEPMNGLDNHGVEDIRRLLLEIKEKGRTILIASHNREDIEVLCDVVYEMDDGILSLKKTFEV